MVHRKGIVLVQMQFISSTSNSLIQMCVVFIKLQIWSFFCMLPQPTDNAVVGHMWTAGLGPHWSWILLRVCCQIKSFIHFSEHTHIAWSQKFRKSEILLDTTVGRGGGILNKNRSRTRSKIFNFNSSRIIDFIEIEFSLTGKFLE